MLYLGNAYLKLQLADYDITGVWVDGDCWATVFDYSPLALTKFPTTDIVVENIGKPAKVSMLGLNSEVKMVN